MSNQTINQWEMPVADQARANPRPQKRQSERSMRYENNYAHYLYPEQIIQRDRDESRKAQAERARNRRAEIREISALFDRNTKEGTLRVAADGTRSVYRNGKWITERQANAKPKAEKGKPRGKKSKLSEAEEEDLIARLSIPNARPARFKASAKIGKAS